MLFVVNVDIVLSSIGIVLSNIKKHSGFFMLLVRGSFTRSCRLDVTILASPRILPEPFNAKIVLQRFWSDLSGRRSPVASSLILRCTSAFARKGSVNVLNSRTRRGVSFLFTGVWILVLIPMTFPDIICCISVHSLVFFRCLSLPFGVS